ncbi:MAG: DUF1800 domain-containing protein [SAR202 cluster bacterium]|nr:DUF1800 domain-containing protein [SAR202 cluster bacterium]
MKTRTDIALVAHLMRRAGFGATRAELEQLAEKPYEDIVEDLLHPERRPEVDEHLLFRYHPTTASYGDGGHAQTHWLYRMVMTQRPLEEKIALFWHYVFATGNAKVENGPAMGRQIEGFRKHGLGNYRDLLVRLAQDPAMIYWLDNNHNHKRAPNENWGRELLELFAMGAGNYTEKDVYECARAFTGWNIIARIGVPWGTYPWKFVYKPEDHDFTQKTFLGHTGEFNGEDIIDIVVRQPATSQFIARHLYNFFVADEPQVPAWPIEPPRDPEAVRFIRETFVDSGYEMKPVLRAIFNSDFFKQAMYEKVKSPVDLVVGTLRLTGDMNGPDPRWGEMPRDMSPMGQNVMDPPSVEGWHTGREWINSGAQLLRVNFTSYRFADTSLPGVQDMISRVASTAGETMTAEVLVGRCLELAGPVKAAGATRAELVGHVRNEGPVSWAPDDYDRSARRVAELLALIGASREFQMG